MKTVIKKLQISNFKGISSLEVTFSNLTKISGANATGKTSIFDAYIWLLFGKNSEDQKDFGVKPYNTSNVEVSVTGYFDINGSEVKLKRVLKEKWTRRRGEGLELTGHETEYYIDDIMIQARKFNEYINNLLPEQDYKLLSKPLYFAQNLRWDERRKILLRAIDITSIDNTLRAKYGIGDANIGILRDQLRRQKNELKKKLDEYPVRIAELERQPVELIDEQKAKNEIELLNKQIESLINQIAVIEAENKKRLEEYQKTSKEKAAAQAAVNDWQLKLANFDRQIEQSKLQAELEEKQYTERIASLKKQITILEDEREKLREEYKVEVSKIYEPQTGLTCYNCGQLLPADKADEINQQAMEKFNSEKRRKLETIKEKGVSIANEIEMINQQVDELIKQKNNKQPDINPGERDVILAELEKATKLYDSIVVPDPQKIEIVSIEETEKQRKELYNKISEIKEKLKINELSKQNLSRIQELREEWQKQGALLSEIERQEIAIDNYEIELAKHIEQEINDLIGDESIHIKTYNKLLNGNLEPACEIYYKGVLYNDVNNATKIQVGIKLIEFVGRVINACVPVWVDNAEAMNNLPVFAGQLIALYVSNSSLSFENIK